MGVSLNCNQGNVVKPNFKGSYQRTENGTPYYKTNSGTIAGAVMAVPAGLAWINALTSPTTKEELEKKSKNIIDMFTPKNISAEDKKVIDDGLKEGLKDAEKKLELNKVLKKRAIPCAIIASGVTLGCGMLVDALRNKRARESAEFVKQVGTKKAVMESDTVSLSNKGRPYYDSKIGKEYGFALGAGCGFINYAMNYSKHNPQKGMAALLGSVISFGLGGLLMGAIADHNTNSDARKHA